MSELLHTLKARRKALGMTQADAAGRLGMTRQQYQRLESEGNPRLDTLELMARGLGMQLMLVPKDAKARESKVAEKSEDLWRGLLPEDDG